MSELERLLKELGQTFGKLSRWRNLCRQENATTEAAQVAIARRVLAEWSTGNVSEGQTRHLEAQGQAAKPLHDC